jgi:chromate reductase
METKIRIVAISGSLRANSSNNVIIKILAGMAPPGVAFMLYEDLAGIPAFNDIDNTAADNFRRLVREADGVFICTPEYAFGVPGALKNALDWTVSSGDFDKKPVALVTASSAGDKAHASLLQTLTALSADVVPDGTLLISFVRSKLNEKGEVTDPSMLSALQSVLNALVAAIRKKRKV